MLQKRYQCFKANLCYMLKEFSILLKMYTGTLIVPPSFDTVHHFLSQITNFVVTLCSTKVYILLFCLACRTLPVADLEGGVRGVRPPPPPVDKPLI
jgi:hypothetical protein